MGNENSKSPELKKEEKIPEKHENGLVNGTAPNATPNGMHIDGTAKNEAVIQQNGKPLSSSIPIDPAEYVINDSESERANDQVIPAIPDATTEKLTNGEVTPEIPAAANEQLANDQVTPDTPEATNEKPDNDKVTPDSTDAPSEQLSIGQVTPDTPNAMDEKPSNDQATANAPDATDEKPVDAHVTFNVPEATTVNEELKSPKKEKVNIFGKMFKKKESSPPPPKAEAVEKKEPSSNDQSDVSLPNEVQVETAGSPKQEPDALVKPGPETPESDPQPEEKAPETEEANGEPVESQEETDPEDNPVMNFFKTLVNPTKTSKQETATPDAAKDQVAQISEPPAPPKGMSIPPPPPPEPPKLDVKGEPSGKAAKPSPKEEPKAAAKEAESSKGKSAKGVLSSFFRQKVRIGIKTPKAKGASTSGANAKTAAVKVDPSKTGTLEAAAKPEPPAPVQEEKKPSKSPFLSLFKPKALLDHMTTKVQAASTSGVRLLRKTSGLAAAPKKEAASPPAAAAEAAQAAKAKEEPKAAAKSVEVVVDNKAAPAASQAADDAAKGAKKLEKRNSIHGFFKNLSQKRHSTDAGVQTEAATEKAK